jgi:hypothetical protein
MNPLVYGDIDVPKIAENHIEIKLGMTTSVEISTDGRYGSGHNSKYQ